VLGECRKKFSNYEFLGDQDVAKSAAVSSRYSDSSLRGVIQEHSTEYILYPING